MLFAETKPHILEFKKPAKTSRNTIEEKLIYILYLRNKEGITGIGEISPFEKLSLDATPKFPMQLEEIVKLINEGVPPDLLPLENLPSIRFGLETALLDLQGGGKRQIYKTDFFGGKMEIPINGLIWMGSTDEILQQVQEKIDSGYSCIKMKVGAMDFDEECRILEKIRKKYSAFRIELRVDANGAFPAADALEMLKELHRFELHSIEQPIRQGQKEIMQELCAKSKLAIALDEELIGIDPEREGEKLLHFIKPQYLILKPGILGGFKVCEEWINLSNLTKGWWITSALESNIGLNAIAQFVSRYRPEMPQGLGTGQLYNNNIPSPLYVKNGFIGYSEGSWENI